MLSLIFKILQFFRGDTVGGERETVVEKTKEKDSKVTSETDAGGYRIHESNGEVHVHDDHNKLKAAVPVSAWWKMWDRLRNEVGLWVWIDPVQKTKLVVETVSELGMIDARISVSKIAFGSTWEKINTFSKKK